MCDCKNNCQLISGIEFIELTKLRATLFKFHCLNLSSYEFELTELYKNSQTIENRFPDCGFYVNLSNGDVADKLRSLIAAFKNHTEKRSFNTIFDRLNDVCEIIFQTNERYMQHGVYDQESYERYCNLFWDERSKCYHEKNCGIFKYKMPESKLYKHVDALRSRLDGVKFVNLDTVRGFLNYIHKKNVKDDQHIFEIKAELSELYSKAISIKLDERIPDEYWYVNISRGPLANKMRRLFGALADANYKNMDYTDFYHDLSVLCSMAFENDKSKMYRFEIFNRKTFESIYGLKWNEEDDEYYE